MFTRSSLRRLGSLLAAALLTLTLGSLVTLTSAGTAGAVTDIDSVVQELDSSHVYVEEGAEAGNVARIESAIDQASQNNVSLYVVVLADDSSGISARDVQDRLGDVTVLLFEPSTYSFESLDICKGRFDQARARADDPITKGLPDDATVTFIAELVELPESECEQGASTSDSGLGLGTWLLIILALVLLIAFVWSVLRAMAASRRARREAADFEERRGILKDWAATLRKPITDLQGPVAAARSSSLATMYNDALKVARESDVELAKAATLPDLDRLEIRIARAQMQIRDVRKALDL